MPIILYYCMNSHEMINSIYNPRKKAKEAFVFPKISKAEASPPQNKVFVRGTGRKYNQQNIFKIEDDKKQRVKLHIQEEKIKEKRQRECQELQMKMNAMNRRHLEQMKEIQEKQRLVQAEIEKEKKKQYQVKYSLWELKNQIMNLNAVYLQQEAEYQRLYQEVGYVEDGENYQEEEGQEGLQGYHNQEEEGYAEGEEEEEGYAEVDEEGQVGQEVAISRTATVQLQEHYDESESNGEMPRSAI